MIRFCIVFLAVISSWTWAAPEKTAQFERQHIKSMSVVAPEWEGYTNADGTGLYWDIFRAIYEPEGIKVNPKTVPWNRAMKMVSKYRTYNAIVGEYRNTDEQVIFPIYPIDVEYMSVLSKKQNGANWGGLKSLSGRTVGWIKDYDVIHESKRDFTLKEFRNIEQGIRLLEAGTIDFLIDDWDEIAAAMQEYKMSTTEYSVNEMPEGKDLFAAFSIDNLSRELIVIYNERIPELAESGELAKIYEKWDTGEMPESVINLTK